MGARQSGEMKKARQLVEKDGLTANAAAKQVGISRSAIYMSKWYKALKNKESTK